MQSEEIFTRCFWVDLENQLSVDYHDQEWGVPVYNDRKLFEMLILEGAQAGLSWQTILNKRQNYIQAFDNFDPAKIATYTQDKQNELLQNNGIIRNKLKIKSAVQNAKVFLEIQSEYKSFSNYLWSFIDNKPITNKFKSILDLPAKTELSDIISKNLKKRGINFVGSTIIYAFMQAVGMVNDHTLDCFRHMEINKL